MKKYLFWMRVRDYAEAKMREHWKSGDIKCPHCLRWSSEIGGVSRMVPCPLDSHITIVTCRQCDGKSRWDFASAPVAIQA